MLAANVDASYSSGELRLSGSIADDHVSIVADPTSGRVVIRGRDGTLVNGLPELGFDAVRELTVNLRGGENELAMQSSTTALATFDNLSLRMGNGDDVLWIDHVRFTETADIVTLRGDDFVVVSDSWLSNLRLNTGLGDDGVQLIADRLDGSSRVVSEDGVDSIDIRGNTFLNSPLNDRFFVSAGSADDDINFVSNTVRNGNSAWIDGGDGSNSGLIVGASHLMSMELPLNQSRPALSGLSRNPGWSKYQGLQSAVTHDVRVTVSNKVARINGTHFDDRLIVDTRLRSEGRQEWIIRGLPGTTVNGQESIVLEDVDAVILNLYGGDDWFSMSDLFRGLGVHITRYESFDVSLGSGDDFFEMVVPQVDGVFSIDAGNDDDFISLHFVKATQLVADLGEGDDAILVNESVFDSISIRGREGDDTFFLRNNRFVSHLVSVDGEVGDDIVIWDQNSLLNDPILFVQGGTGDDTLYYDNRDYRNGIRSGPSGIGSEFETRNFDPFVWPDGVLPLSLHTLDFVWQIYGRLLPDSSIFVR